MVKQKKLLIILIGVIVIGCSAFLFYKFIYNTNKNIKSHVTIEKQAKAEETPAPTNSDEKKYDYAVMIGSTRVGVSDNVNEQQLISLLGDPISEKTEVSGPEAFPYAGLTFKTKEYDGLTIVICKAKDEKYYIINMTVKSENYPTSLGIKVGDTVEKLKEIYPVEEKESQDPTKIIYYYFEGESGGWAMQFEVSDDKITEFNLSEVWD
jgi:hypothetical protein